MQLKKLHQQIWYYEGALDNPNDIIQYLEFEKSTDDRNLFSDWREWYTKEGELVYSFGQQLDIIEEELDKSDSRVSLQLKKLKSNFLSLGKEYANEFRLPLVDPCSMVVSKYSPSKEMGPHVDSTEDMNARALMTAILYLNDDYEGGDLYFPEQEIRLKPKAGSIVFFPSVKPFYHQSFKITKGYKYIVPLFWVQYL